MNQLHKWHQTKLGLLIFALAELAVSYGFISLAIDRADLWWYILTLIFFIGFLQNLAKLIRELFSGQK